MEQDQPSKSAKEGGGGLAGSFPVVNRLAHCYIVVCYPAASDRGQNKCGGNENGGGMGTWGGNVIGGKEE